MYTISSYNKARKTKSPENFKKYILYDERDAIGYYGDFFRPSNNKTHILDYYTC